MIDFSRFRSPGALASILTTIRRRRWTIVSLVAALALAASPFVLRLRVDPDVLNLLPQSGPRLRSFRTYLSAFGSLDRVYIVFEAPEGESIDDYASAVERAVEALRALPEIADVDSELFGPGKDWQYLGDRVFQLLGTEGTRRALRDLSPTGIEARLAHARDRLALAPPSVKELLRRDPLDFLGLLRGHLAGAQAFVRVDPTKEGYVSADGRARLVIARPTHPPFDTDFSRRVVADVERATRAVRSDRAGGTDEDPLPPLGIRFGGGYHVAVETEREVRREAIFNVLGSLAGILLLLVVVFRSAWLFLVGALPMSIAALLSAALNGWFSTRLSAVSAGASALLFGLGVDGLVLLYARYLEERPAVNRPEQAIARSSGAAVSMLLGMATSAATFLALAFVRFPSLQELGRLIGVGMLCGGVLTLLLVPALLLANARSRRAPVLHALPRLLRNRTRAVLVATAVATALLAAAIPRLRVDLSLERLQPRTPQIAADREIARRFGLPDDLVLILGEGADLETLLERDATVIRTLALRRPGLPAFSVSSLLPPERHQAAVADVIGRAGAGDLSGRVAAAAASVGFRPDAFAPFLERWPRLADPANRLTYEGYVQHGLAGLLAPYVAKTASGFVTAAYARPRSQADMETLRQVVREVGAGSTVTGLPLVNQELAETLVPQFAAGVIIGAVAVFALMLAVFRKPGLTALALLPTCLGLVWSAGLLALLGVTLDLFSLFGILAFIGIGVDYGIHLVHRYAAEEDLSEALARIAPVNLVSAGIAILGCGTLVTSSYPPLRSLGIVSVVTLATCLVGALLVLPACLMLPGASSKAGR